MGDEAWDKVSTKHWPEPRCEDAEGCRALDWGWWTLSTEPAEAHYGFTWATGAALATNRIWSQWQWGGDRALTLRNGIVPLCSPEDAMCDRHNWLLRAQRGKAPEPAPPGLQCMTTHCFKVSRISPHHPPRPHWVLCELSITVALTVTIIIIFQC